MIYKFHFLSVLALLLFFRPEAGAQTIPVNTKFGAVSDAELEMTVYPPDTSAAVVVLYRNQEVEATISSALGFARRIIHTERIKILKESGKDYADFKIYYSTDCEPREYVEGIKVVTYNKENGKTIVNKLPRKLIFDEEVSENRRAVSFSPQNVRVGSVVEITFTYESPYVADIGTIFLQTSVPVNLSMASFRRAEYFNFSRMMRGFEHCSTTTDASPGSVLVDGGGQLDFSVYTDNHRAVDVPALKSAPYCFCPDLYRLGFTYELRSININNLYYKEYNATWEQLDEDFRTEGVIREFYSKSRFAAEVAAAMASTEGEAAQVAAIRKAVLDKVRWNGKTRSYPSSAKAFKAKEGSSADLNALMASALNEAGFKADPVFLMTRDRGLLLNAHVSSDSYTAVIIRVTAPSGTVWFMDTAFADGYLNVLPVNHMAQQARVIPLKDGSEWVDLGKLSRNQLLDSVAMEVSADGSISGKRTQRGYNNRAATMKAAFRNAGSPDSYAEQVEEEDHLEMTDMVFSDNDVWSPDAVLEYSFTASSETAGDMIYVRPFLSKYQDESDFKDPERMIPIDFAYPETINYTATVMIPEGFSVESMPQSTALTCAPAGSRTIMQCVYDGDRTVSLNFRFNINERILTSENYKVLRDYWGHLCNIYDSTIVLKKN